MAMPAQQDSSGAEDVLTRLLLAQCGACTCLTKTPEPQDHAPNCTYRVLSDAAGEIRAFRAKARRWDAIATLMILGDVAMAQAESGGYNIYVEPAENGLPQSWKGDTLEQAADKVAEQLAPPNRNKS